MGPARTGRHAEGRLDVRSADLESRRHNGEVIEASDHRRRGQEPAFVMALGSLSRSDCRLRPAATLNDIGSVTPDSPAYARARRSNASRIFRTTSSGCEWISDDTRARLPIAPSQNAWMLAIVCTKRWVATRTSVSSAAP